MMKFLFILLATAISTIGFADSANAWQERETPAAEPAPVQDDIPEQKSENQVTADGKIRFSFQDQDWRDVIPWFANEANFQLQQVEDWPEGVFNLQDPDDYSVIDALDQLNHALRLLKPEPYTLIRNRRMLVLVRVSDSDYPDELIETVKVEDLKTRGKYEIMDCMFDLGDLDGELMFEELQPIIKREFREKYSVFLSSNQLAARGTGEDLRMIHKLIEDAIRIKAENKRGLLVYDLEFQDPETFISMIGPQLGFRPDATSNEAETISITAEPLGNRLYVNGTKKMRDEFTSLAKLIDSDPRITDDDVTLDKPFFVNYPILGDPKVAFNLLQNILEGTGSKMEQDETSGAIVVLARKEDHKRVREGLEVLAGGADEFAIIKLKKIDVAEAMTVLQTLFQQNTLDSNAAPKGPEMIANSDQQTIIVSGSVQEVAKVKMMCERLDAEAPDPIPTGPRTRIRMIPMDEADQQRVMSLLPDLLGSTNRTNSFRIIKPKERKTMGRRIRGGEFEDPTANIEEPVDSLILPTARPAPAPQPKESENRDQNDGREPRSRRGRTSLWQRTSDLMLVTTVSMGLQPGITGLLWQDEETESTDETPNSRYQDPEYKPAPKINSVPGAPIEFRFNEYGLTIDTLDLDASDDIEYAIRSILGEESRVQMAVFYELEYRKASEVKQLLEVYFGREEQGGGGGGGGGLLGGIASNMLGPAGGMLDGLLDVAGGGGGGGGDLEGDVSFGLDDRFNSLWVRGATDNDLAQINDLIDYWDRPEGSVKPEISGEFETIDVIHREAEELVELIKQQMPDMIRDPEAEKQQGGGNAEMKQLANMLKAVQGGKAKSGGSDNGENMPKATLSADPMTNKLLVTGPPFIYEQILLRVSRLDVPDLTEPQTSFMVPMEYGPIQDDLMVLQSQFKNKIIIENGEGENGGANGTSRTSTAGRTPTPKANTPNAGQAAFLNAIRSNPQMIRAMSGGQGARGARGNTGGGRTGGGGGRGGRGGR